MKSNLAYVVNKHSMSVEPERVYMFHDGSQYYEPCQMSDLDKYMDQAFTIVVRYPPDQKFEMTGCGLAPYRMETEQETKDRLEYHRVQKRAVQEQADRSWERQKRRFQKARQIGK